MRIEKRTVIVDGERVIYKVAGQGPPLLLIHGLSGSSGWWRRNIDVLSQNNSLYLVDLPGYGLMRKTPIKLSLTVGAQWLHDFMMAVGIEKTSLIGHSMGGYIALLFSVNYPLATDKLILVAPAGLEQPSTLASHVLPLFRTTLYTNPRFLPILLHDALMAGPQTIIRSAKEIISQDIRESASEVKSPTLLIWGNKDTLVSPVVGNLLHESIPSSQLIILERAGHVPMFDRPKQFNNAVVEFMESSHS